MAVYGNNYDYGDSPLYKDEEAPVEAQNYYVDLSQVETGIGSEDEPFNDPQLVNYFDASEGDDCGVVPGDGDILNVKGTASLISRNAFIIINRDIVGTIIIKPWDWARNGIWLIETKDAIEETLYVVRNENERIVDHLILEGYAFLQNKENGIVIATYIDYPGSGVIIEHKNHQIYCRYGDIYEVPAYDYTIKHNGFTFYADSLIIDGVGTYPSSFQDGVAKVNGIVEYDGGSD